MKNPDFPKTRVICFLADGMQKDNLRQYWRIGIFVLAQPVLL